MKYYCKLNKSEFHYTVELHLSKTLFIQLPRLSDELLPIKLSNVNFLLFELKITNKEFLFPTNLNK